MYVDLKDLTIRLDRTAWIERDDVKIKMMRNSSEAKKRE